MKNEHQGYPGLPADYFPLRFGRLERRGDLVRAYKRVAAELRESLIAEISAGRKLSAVVLLRPFLDCCFACLFAAYPASEREIVKKSSPKNFVEAAKRIIEHWQLPIPAGEIAKLDESWKKLSQAVHVTPKAARKMERWSNEWTPAIPQWANLLMQLVEEADLRLNSHKGRKD